MCGIAGFIGLKDQKTFDESLLRYITMEQDSRGGQGIGMIFHAEYTDPKTGEVSDRLQCTKRTDDRNRKELSDEFGKGEDLSTFVKLYWAMEIDPRYSPFNKLKPPFKFIAHARKASVGPVDLKHTHPHIVNREDGSLICGVHNGTLYSYPTEKLAEKLEVDIKGISSDSHQLYTMMASSPENLRTVLSTYSGAAALVWIDSKDEDVVHFWVGASNYGQKAQERPLHYLETKEGLFFSSEIGPLEDIVLMKGIQSGYCKELPKKFQGNCITTIKHGKIINIEEIERKAASTYNSKKATGEQTATNTQLSATTSSSVLLSNTASTGTSSKVSKKLCVKDFVPQQYINIAKASSCVYIQGGRYIGCDGKLLDSKVIVTPSKDEEDDSFHKRCEVIPTYLTARGSHLRYDKIENEYYYVNSNTLYVGKLPPKECYFYKGLLLRGKSHLVFIHFKLSENEALNPNSVKNSAAMPMWLGTALKAKNPETSSFMSPTKGEGLYSGFFVYPYTHQAAYFVNGILVENFQGKDSIEMFQKAILKRKSDRNMWCNTCNRTLPGIVDCFKCESGQYDPLIKDLVTYDEYLCVYCQKEEVKETGDICTSCKNYCSKEKTTKGVKYSVKYSAQEKGLLHPIDKLPAVTSDYQDLVLAVKECSDPMTHKICTSCFDVFHEDSKLVTSSPDYCHSCLEEFTVKDIISPDRKKKILEQRKKKESDAELVSLIPQLAEYEKFFNAYSGQISEIEKLKKNQPQNNKNCCL